MYVGAKYGLYASVYSVNPAHDRQETKESIFIVGALLSSQHACVGIPSTVLKKRRNISCEKNKAVVCVRQTMVYCVNQAKIMALNMLT